MSKKLFIKLKQSKLYCSLGSSFLGILIILVCLLIFSFVMTKIDIPEQLVSVMTTIALCFGSYWGGYVASKNRGKNGILIGSLTGLIIFVVIFIAGVILVKSSITLGFITKLIITVICAAIGGIIGVNSKIKRY